MKKERLGIEFDRRRLEERIRKVKDVLPLAEQIMRLKVVLQSHLTLRDIDNDSTMDPYPVKSSILVIASN